MIAFLYKKTMNNTMLTIYSKFLRMLKSNAHESLILLHL